jgi:hypothetical protein
MINISVKFDARAVAVKLFELRDQVIKQATATALNKVAKQVKTAAAKEIRAAGYKNFPAAIIKEGITIDRASAGRLKVVIRCTGRPIPLILFSAKEVPGGISVNVKNGRKVIRGAFIATMQSGHKGVFVREGKGHKKIAPGQWHGLPIKELFGPGIPSQFGNEIVQAALVSLVTAKFPTILEHEIKYYGSR